MKYVFILLLLFSTEIALSQTFNKREFDSLVNVLKTEKVDTSKVNLYFKITQLFEFNDDENDLIYYNDKILKLSKKIDYKKGIGFYYQNLCIIKFIQHNEKEFIQSGEKSIKIFSELNDTYNYLEANRTLSFFLILANKPQLAKVKISKILQLSKSTKYHKITADFYTMLGMINYYDKKVSESMLNFKKSLNYHNKNNSVIKDKVELYRFMVESLIDLERYEEALYYLLLIEDRTETLIFKNNKAFILSKLKKYTEALTLFLEIDSSSQSLPEYAKKSITFSIAEVYYHLGQLGKALEFLKKLNYEEMDFIPKIEYSNLLSKCFLGLKEIEKAQLYNEKTLVLVDTLKLSSFKQNALLTKSQIEEQKGNFEMALLYYKKHTAIKEERDLKLNKDKMNELQTSFGVEEKNYAIDTLEMEKAKKNLQIDKQRGYIIIISLVLAFTVLFILFFIRSNRLIKAKNKIIAKNNFNLKNSIAEKETLLKEIHHRVKNNLQLVMSLLYIQSKQKDTNIDYFIEISQSRIISMALIHENLYKIKDLSRVDFKEYINNLTQSIFESYSHLKTNVDLKIDVEPIYLDIQTAIPLGLIINELVNNALKHAFKNNRKGIISVVLKEKVNKLELEIADDGCGVVKQEKVKKTLGIELVKQLVGQIQGILSIENNLGLRYSIQFENK